MKISKLIDDEEWLKDFCARVRSLCPAPPLPPHPHDKWDLEETVALDERMFNEFRNRLASKNIQFTDPEFRPSKEAMGDAAPPFSIAWLRPRQISISEPVFLTREQHEPYRISSRGNGSRRLAAVIHAISFNDALRSRVVPDDQSFTGNYAGIFRFTFWQFGEWVPIVIDDRLPVKKTTKEFVFNSFSNMPDYWVCLVEKAYAKFIGGYGEINKLSLPDILRHFTGGIGEFYNTKAMKAMEMSSIKMGLNRGSIIMALASQGSDCRYNVRGIYKEKETENPEIFVRLWNPFENYNPDVRAMTCFDQYEQETQISRRPGVDLVERNCLDLAPDYNNTFWVTLTKFCALFDFLLICNPRSAEISHNTDGHWCSLQKWYFFTVRSKWVSKETYESSCSDINAICCNSQVRIKVTTPDYEGRFKTSRSTVIVSLLQRRGSRSFDRKNFQCISLLVYNLCDPKKEPFKLSRKFLETHEPLYQSFQFSEEEISVRLYLDPGIYVLIPVTDRWEEEEEYLLTLCSLNPVEPVLPLIKTHPEAVCHVQVIIECPESIVMGEPIDGIVYVANRYNEAKRICYNILTERIVQGTVQPIASKIEFVKLGPMLSLVVALETNFSEYAHLTELKLKDMSVRTTCVCYVFDEGQSIFEEKTVEITLPRLEITPIGSVLVSERCLIEAAWTNSLPITVSVGSFQLDKSIRQKYSIASVEPYKTARWIFKTCFFRGGWNEITVDFSSNILDLHRSLLIMVEDTQLEGTEEEELEEELNIKTP